MACIRAETGTLIFAIINLIAVILSSVTGVVIMGFCLASIVNDPYRWIDSSYVDPDKGKFFIIVGTLLTLSLIDMIFSAFLMNGILNKRPRHINKAYFVFGVMKTVVWLLIVIGAYVYIEEISLLIMGGVVSTIFGLVLHMIRITYKQYEEGNKNDPLGHQRLVDN